MSWLTQKHLKRGDQLFGANTDRVSINWNSPLEENHGTNSCKQHLKIANKSDDKKAEIIWEQKTYDGKKKQIMKLTMDHGDCRTGTQVDLEAVQHEGTGLIWSEGENKAHLGYRMIWNYTKKSLAHNMALHYGGKAFGETAKMYLHSDWTANFKDLWTYNNMSVLNQFWIVDGDVSAGVRFGYNFQTKQPDVVRLEGQYNVDKESAVWGHLDYPNKFAALAYDHTYTLAKVHMKNTAMLTASWQEGVKQFMGTPIGFRIGTDMQFSKDMKCTSNWGVGKQLFFNFNCMTTIKKNYDFGVHCHFLKKNHTHSGGETYAMDQMAVGFELHYKCEDLFTEN